MTLNILAYMREPERSAMRLERLANEFEGVTVHVASSIDEAAEALAEAQVLVSIGGHLGNDAAAIFD